MNFDLLKRLCETPGIPGYEDRLRALVKEELRPLVDELRTDVMGNVVGIKRGRAPRVMVAAHMDEIGFMVRYIDKNGFLRLQPLGGFDARMLVAQRVLVHTRSGQTLRGALMASTRPTHVLTEEERNRAPKLEQLFVDLGLPAEKVQELVEVGDMVTMDRTTEQLGENVISKSLDDRLSVYVMLEALRAVRHHEVEIVAVATTQEEVGLRGATTAAYALEPQIGIALDITLALDIPGIEEHEAITRLGKGAAIKLMDSSVISHPKLVRHFREIAEREKVPYQLEILPRGGTDAGAIQRARAGVVTMTLSVPVRYVHTVNEMAAISDIEAAVTLLARYLEEAHTGDYAL
jgi:putative aminopeptidase FrvX